MTPTIDGDFALSELFGKCRLCDSDGEYRASMGEIQCEQHYKESKTALIMRLSP